MSKEIEAFKKLRERVEKVADECELDVNVFSLIVPDDSEKPALQIVFGVRANAVKAQAVLEQERYDSEFEAMISGGVLRLDDDEEPAEEEDDYSDVMKDLGDWMEGFKDG